MFEQDWLMRQIKGFAYFLAKLIFNKPTAMYTIEEDNLSKQADLLHKKLISLIKAGKLNQAENTLFDSIMPDDKKYLELAIDFYSRLNDLSDEELARFSFTRGEIEEGLNEMLSIFRIELPRIISSL